MKFIVDECTGTLVGSWLRELGYKVFSVYECVWIEFKRTHKKCQDFISKFFSDRMCENTPMTEQSIIECVLSEKFFGLVECDIHVPDTLKNYFSEMLPIFKNTTLSRNDLPQHMFDYATKFKIMSQPQRALIGSYFGKKILLLTPLLKWYLEHGLEVTKVYQIVQYNPKKCFETFGKSVCQARRLGDEDSSKAILAETAKLSGNVMYGTTITNKECFTDVKYITDANRACKYANSARFLGLNELSPDLYEVNLAKKSVMLDTPIIIGFCILQYAKLRMLEFYYDFMCKFFDRSTFQYVCMDTDSAYLAMSDDFEKLIKPHLLTEFYSEYENWFPPQFCEKHKDQFVHAKICGNKWNMKSCCESPFKFHRRTPGLFKLEFSGTGIIALNSKTYYSFSEQAIKMSTKGIMKK
jgi:hypothetical protein